MASFNLSPFSAANDIFAQARREATVSPQSLDTASARIRSRVNSQEGAYNRQIADQYGQQGRANSGAAQGALQTSRAAAQNAYATGQANLQNDFWGRQQEGAGILSGIAANQAGAGLGQAQAGNLDERIVLDQTAVQNQAAQAKTNSLIEFLNTFGTFGNTPFLTPGRAPGTPAYDAEVQSQNFFNNIIQQIFNQFGGM